MTANKTKLAELSARREALLLKRKLSNDKAERANIGRWIKDLEAQIGKLRTTNGNPVVSDHALIRYLQRVKGLDLTALSNEILNGNEEHIRKMSSCTIKLANGMRIIVRNCVVVTVLDKKTTD